MFGRKKMYKKGLADALQANEAFAKKQEEAIAHLREEVSKGKKSLEDALNDAISSLNGDIDGFYKYLNSKEKKALYNLCTPMDIKDLEEEEKQLLVAILYQLSFEEKINQSQSKFISSIQKYLQISNPQMGITLTSVGNIDSLAVQKAFLQVVLEFYYLKFGNEISDAQEEFLSYFSINKAQAELIEQRVSEQFSILGTEGLAEKYGFEASSSKAGLDDTYTDKTLFVETRGEIEKILNGWTYDYKYVTFYVSLPHIDIVSIDSYSTKSSCKAAAESELRKLYNAANEILGTYSSKSLVVQAIKSVDYIREVFEKIHHHTRMLKKYVGIGSELARIDELTDYKSFVEAMTEKFKEILNDGSYSLESFNYYAEDIEYENDDCEIEEGFWRVIEKFSARWDWDMITTRGRLTDDFDRFCDIFCTDASYAVYDYFKYSVANRIVELLDEIASKLKVKK